MSDDDLKRLADALKSTPPAPDEAAKAENIALAMKNFDRLQGSAADARPTPERTRWGARIGQGVGKMFAALNSRGALAATTALTVVAVAVVFTYPQIRGTDGLGPIPEVRERTSVPTPPRTEPSPVAPQADTSAPPVVQPVAPGTPQAELKVADGSGTTAPTDTRTSTVGDDEADAFSAQVGGLALEEAPMPSPPPMPLGRVQAGESFVVSDLAMAPEPNTETFANDTPNPLKVTAEEPVSTFSIDVDTASYAVIRSSLMNGYMPPKDAVRVEEMVNYFPYSYATPMDGQPFRPTVTVMQTPWNAGTELVHIGIQGELPAAADRPALNLVFLIDTSGSMQDADKLPLLKQSFRLMLSQLRPEDEVSIVTYAGSAGQVLEPTPAGERSTILAALDRLEAGGSTAGQAGLQQAYAVAESMAGDGEVTRVILATDGDFNVGISDPEALKDYIADQRDSGVYLSVLGFGRGNLDDATMQALAQNGNGTAAYIDTLSEAQKVLVDQLSGALFPIADDVKIQVEFNPATVAEYRLIGYETRALAREDFNNDKVDAGEIGAGHTVTAIYEVTPVGSDAVMTDALRYQPATGSGDASNELGFLKMRYKLPGESVSTLIETPILPGMGSAGTDTRFAAAIAGFGQLLRDDRYLGDWGYGEAIALATANKGADPYGYRAEAVTLMRLAETLSER